MESSEHKAHFTVENSPEAALHARQALAKLAEFLADETYADLRVVVSELVANGAEHGPAGPVSVWIELLADGGVRGWVRDGGTGGVKIAEGQQPGTGLGLLIVDTLAAGWGTHPGSSDVWFELAAPGVRRPSPSESNDLPGRSLPADAARPSRLRARARPREECK